MDNVFDGEFKYDADAAPDAAEWLEMDEGERIYVVTNYHERSDQLLGDEGRDNVHAAIHAVVEVQLAARDPLVASETMERLLSAGVKRHDAIHAVGNALAEEIHHLQGQGGHDPDRYATALRALNPADWK